jgi:TolB-like protein/Tfp pilus assembly protein PilF
MSSTPSLWQALSRRKVIQATGIYMAAAWVLLQVTELTADIWATPDWVLQVLFIVLAAGIPVTAALAWAYELNEEGVTADAGHGFREVMHRGGAKAWLTLATLVAVVGVALWLGVRTVTDAPDRTASEHSVAVLPFANMSDEADNAYFADGVAEEVLHLLAAVPTLEVAARTSSFRYRGDNIPTMQAIGAELGVATVLEGSVRRQGDQVRVTAQLIDARDGYHLWSETFDRDLDDIFAVQSEIAEAIAEAMRITITGEVRTEQARRASTDVDAYSLYLAARAHIRERSEAALWTAVELLEQAVEKDADYAPAWAALGEAYNLLENGMFGNLSRDDLTRLALPAIERALELDPELPDAYASLGLYWLEVDNEKASTALERAIELGAREGRVYNWLGLAYGGSTAADVDKVVEVLREGVRVDPHFMPVNTTLGNVLSWNRRWEEAAEQWERTLPLLDREDRARGWHRYLNQLAQAYDGLGDNPNLIRVLREKLSLVPNDKNAMAWMMDRLYEMGLQQDAELWALRLRREFPIDRLNFGSHVMTARSLGDIVALRETGAQLFQDDEEPDWIKGQSFRLGLWARDYAAVLVFFDDIQDRYRDDTGAFVVNQSGHLRVLAQAWHAARATGDPRAAELEAVLSPYLDGDLDTMRARFAGDDPVRVVYMLAFALQAAGDSERAVEALLTAADLDPDRVDITLMRDDPLLAEIAAHPDFADTLARLEAEEAEQQARLAAMELASYSPLSDRPIVDVPLDILERYAGDYAEANGEVWSVRLQDGALVLDFRRRDDWAPMRLHALAEDEFFSSEGWAGVHLYFETDDLGRATHIVPRNPANVWRVSRVETIEVVELELATKERLLGHYLAAPGQHFPHYEISLVDGTLMLDRGGFVVALEALSATEFIIEGTVRGLRFEGDVDGHPERIVTDFWGGAHMEWVGRVLTETFAPEFAAPIAGLYTLDDSVYAITHKDGQLLFFSLREPDDKWPMTLLDDDTFIMGPPGMPIRIDRDDAGAITGLTIYPQLFRRDALTRCHGDTRESCG